MYITPLSIPQGASTTVSQPLATGYSHACISSIMMSRTGGGCTHEGQSVTCFLSPSSGCPAGQGLTVLQQTLLLGEVVYGILVRMGATKEKSMPVYIRCQ